MVNHALLDYRGSPECERDVLCMLARFGFRNLVELFLDGGMSVDAGVLHPPLVRPHIDGQGEFLRISGGKTPLMAAVWFGSWSVAQLLLDRGADVNARMENGFTVFMNIGYARNQYLLEQGRLVECAESEGDEYKAAAVMLLEHRADLNLLRDDGMTPLMNACLVGLSSVARLLLENSAAVNAGDMSNLTALMVATQRGFKETVELLLSHRADATTTDISNSSAIEHALMIGRFDIANMLRDSVSD